MMLINRHRVWCRVQNRHVYPPSSLDKEKTHKHLIFILLHPGKAASEYYTVMVPVHSSAEEVPGVGVARENIFAAMPLHLLDEWFPIAMYCMQQQQQQPNGVLQSKATCIS